MKVAILWTRLSGYLNICIQELARREGVEFFVCHKSPDPSAPFENDLFSWMTNRLTWDSAPDFDLIETRLRSFSPDVMIFAGWHVKPYRRLARRFAGRCMRVMAMDNPWEGTLKQRAAVLASRYYLRPLADRVWVPGERQAVFARKMGFAQSEIMRGSLSCNQPLMAEVYLKRIAEHAPLPHKFIFVGRLSAEKGVDTLTRAYELYRKRQTNPWPMLCCGAGPLRSLLEGKPGVELAGFIQPSLLPSQLATAGCLVLSGAWDHWALVVHEAASAGLLILAAENVGATVHLVQPNLNGYISGNGNVDELAKQMGRISAMSNDRLETMSRASHGLSQQFSPGRWADTILDSFDEWSCKKAGTDLRGINTTTEMQSPSDIRA